jgi:hypothetical protein
LLPGFIHNSVAVHRYQGCGQGACSGRGWREAVFAGKPKWSFTEVAEILLKKFQWAKESVKPLPGRDNVVFEIETFRLDDE